MTTRKKLRFCLLAGLWILMCAGIWGAFATWGGASLLRLELWLCLLGVGCYLWRILRLLLRRRGEVFWCDVLEASLACLAIIMVVLEYWVFPMQVEMAGTPAPVGSLYRLVGRIIPIAILMGWILLGQRGVGSLPHVMVDSVLPLAYLVLGVVYGLKAENHPYFFFNPATVGERGIGEWAFGWLILTLLALLLMAAMACAMPEHIGYPQNQNRRGVIK